MSTPLVEVRALCKRYPVLGHRGDRLAAHRQVLLARAQARKRPEIEAFDLF